MKEVKFHCDTGVWNCSPLADIIEALLMFSCYRTWIFLLKHLLCTPHLYLCLFRLRGRPPKDYRKKGYHNCRFEFNFVESICWGKKVMHVSAPGQEVASYKLTNHRLLSRMLACFSSTHLSHRLKRAQEITKVHLTTHVKPLSYSVLKTMNVAARSVLVQHRHVFYSISVSLWLVSLCGQGSGETRADLGRTVVRVVEGFTSFH